MNEWRLSSRMLLKRLLKRFFKVQLSPILIPCNNGNNKTILKNLKQQFMGLLSSNLTYVPHILNVAKILEGEIERLTEMPAATGP